MVRCRRLRDLRAPRPRRVNTARLNTRARLPRRYQTPTFLPGWPDSPPAPHPRWQPARTTGTFHQRDPAGETSGANGMHDLETAFPAQRRAPAQPQILSVLLEGSRAGGVQTFQPAIHIGPARIMPVPASALFQRFCPVDDTRSTGASASKVLRREVHQHDHQVISTIARTWSGRLATIQPPRSTNSVPASTRVPRYAIEVEITGGARMDDARLTARKSRRFTRWP